MELKIFLQNIWTRIIGSFLISISPLDHFSLLGLEKKLFVSCNDLKKIGQVGW